MSTDARALGAWARGGLAVVAAYVAFLLFAQFGFLAQAQRDLADPRAVQAVMAAMGVAGLAASLAAGALLGRVAPRVVVRAALAGTAAVAAGSLACHAPVALAIVGAAIGAALGVLTVAIAASLRDLCGSRHAGLAAGAGTGIAYFLCNVPPLFEAPPAVRALVPAALALLAAALLPAEAGPRGEPRLRAGHSPAPTHPPTHLGAGRLVRAVVAFAALVLLDSAAFAVIQAQPALKALSWGSDAQKWLQGVTHLAAALGAGLLLDAGLFASLLGATAALFALAFPLLLGQGPFAAAGGPLYAVGISIYSTALVFYPSRGGDGVRPAPRWRAALLYGLSGWIGSALGVGAAQDLGTIPAGLIAAAAAAVALAWATPSPDGWRRLARHAGLAGAVAAAGLAGWWGTHLLPAPRARLAETEHRVARGREVYIAEGCIHCHSQYVRPDGPDALFWGPARPLDRAQRPVLPGNRRQGPDLLEVGNRRAPAWNEAHLRDPRSVSPGSRMPSYAHLFADGDARGQDLVAYLDALGQGTGPEHDAAIRAERPPRPARPPSVERGRALFAGWCAACHGRAGRGDGPLAAAIDNAALNLHKHDYAVLKGRSQDEPLADALARVVRHGFPPTPMPGHETLPDQQVADLVAYVLSLRDAP